jgi:hypothetical protein
LSFSNLTYRVKVRKNLAINSLNAQLTIKYSTVIKRISISTLKCLIDWCIRIGSGFIARINGLSRLISGNINSKKPIQITKKEFRSISQSLIYSAISLRPKLALSSSKNSPSLSLYSIFFNSLNKITQNRREMKQNQKNFLTIVKPQISYLNTFQPYLFLTSSICL